ncbi:MAG: HAMP domain-containing protein [Candidatus Firestonebacteria bacterium]|nr:HAMP domain-containing protein [Candidatus Firestonebacteria bacterium]
MFNKFGKNSIRTRFKAAFSFLVILPLFLLGIILIWQSYIVQFEQSKNLQIKILDEAENQVKNYIYNFENNLNMMISMNDINNKGDEEQYIILSKMLLHNSKYYKNVFNELVLVDEKGKEKIHLSRVSIYTKDNLISRSKDLEFVIPINNNKIYYSPVFSDKITGEPYINIGIPIIDIHSGLVKNVLIAKIHLRDIWEIVTNIYLDRNIIVYILDNQNKIIAHPNPSIILRGTFINTGDMSEISKGLSGFNVFKTVKKIVLCNQIFYIVAERPVIEALYPTIQIVLFITVIFLIAITGALVLRYIVNRQVIQPIESLASVAKQISNGNLSAQAIETTGDEFGTLANVFNNMTGKLIRTIEEKEVLLKEIHHRVKNNMQIISSILNLQTGYTSDKETITALRESRDRIQVMALIHEKLYQSKNLSKIDFYEYIDELITNLFSSYGIKSEIIKFEIDVKNIFLNINTAIPCGLIINELISNCLKHAFPNRKSGKVKLSIYNDNETYTIIVSDDGIGLPENFDYRKTESLGIKLVASLINQLNGTLTLDKNMGTTFKIMFQVKGNTI